MATPPDASKIFEDLLDITNRGPDLRPEDTSYGKALSMANRFVTWSNAVSLEPVHVDKIYVADGVGKFKSKPTITSPRIASRIIEKMNKSRHDKEDHHENESSGGHHDHHDHHGERNLLLPHFGIKKVFTPPPHHFEPYRRFWPIANVEVGLPPFKVNNVWLIGETIPRGGDKKIGFFDNKNGTVRMTSGTIGQIQELEGDPSEESSRVPDTLSTISILRATAKYAAKNGLDHTKF